MPPVCDGAAPASSGELKGTLADIAAARYADDGGIAEKRAVEKPSGELQGYGDALLCKILQPRTERQAFERLKIRALLAANAVD